MGVCEDSERSDFGPLCVALISLWGNVERGGLLGLGLPFLPCCAPVSLCPRQSGKKRQGTAMAEGQTRAGREDRADDSLLSSSLFCSGGGLCHRKNIFEIEAPFQGTQ